MGRALPPSLRKRDSSNTGSLQAGSRLRPPQRGCTHVAGMVGGTGHHLPKCGCLAGWLRGQAGRRVLCQEEVTGQAGAKRWQRAGGVSQALPCSGAGSTEEEEMDEGCCSRLQGRGCNQGCSWDHNRRKPNCLQPPPTGACVEKWGRRQPCSRLSTLRACREHSPCLGTAGARATMSWG